MKRELGIARCGLACCLCTENVTCNGCDSNGCPDNEFCENKKCSVAKELSHCYKCEENCRKGLLGKIKPYTFTLLLKNTEKKNCWIVWKKMRKMELCTIETVYTAIMMILMM